MAGAVLALAHWLPVPSVGAFAFLAISGMLVYGLAAIGLNICEARAIISKLAHRLVGRPSVIAVAVSEPPLPQG
jgi:hypothetical protein